MKYLLWKIKTAILTFFGHRALGARALVIQNDQVLLIQHTYMPLWYTVGGTIEKGETPIDAVKRELQEEVGITCLEPPQLFNVYLNTYRARNDYVILYLVKNFTMTPVHSPEILATQWFPLNALPADISPATQRRIQEFLGERSLSENW